MDTLSAQDKQAIEKQVADEKAYEIWSFRRAN